MDSVEGRGVNEERVERNVGEKFFLLIRGYKMSTKSRSQEKSKWFKISGKTRKKLNDGKIRKIIPIFQNWQAKKKAHQRTFQYEKRSEKVGKKFFERRHHLVLVWKGLVGAEPVGSVRFWAGSAWFLTFFIPWFACCRSQNRGKNLSLWSIYSFILNIRPVLYPDGNYKSTINSLKVFWPWVEVR